MSAYWRCSLCKKKHKIDKNVCWWLILFSYQTSEERDKMLAGKSLRHLDKPNVNSLETFTDVESWRGILSGRYEISHLCGNSYCFSKLEVEVTLVSLFEIDTA